MPHPNPLNSKGCFHPHSQILIKALSLKLNEGSETLKFNYTAEVSTSANWKRQQMRYGPKLLLLQS